MTATLADRFPCPLADQPADHGVPRRPLALRVSAIAGLALLVSALGCRESNRSLPTDIVVHATVTDASASASAIVLRGTVVTPNGPIKNGYVGVVAGRIVSVTTTQPDIPGAMTVNTNGIILPGLVDIHNHVPWNVLPRWKAGRVFSNRNQWRTDPVYLQTVDGPFSRLMPTNGCDMNTWGELRALVGGTTSVMATHPIPCIHGLVRNLDLNSEFYGTTELDLEHIYNVLELPPANQPPARAAFVAAARFFIANPFYEALVMHVAEGTDFAAQEEFTFLNSQQLLNPKGAVIHGLSLGAADFQAMAAAGTALVWSPRSNLELYNVTSDVGAALDAGVDIALAPDWAITGSSNMLDELKVASRWNRQRLGARLSDQQLVEMVTVSPARIAGVDDEVGAIRGGLRADLLVIRGDQNTPYRALVDARPADVQLVLIQGVPLYGSQKLMGRFWTRRDLEDIGIPGDAKAFASQATGINVSALALRLTAAMKAEGTPLAPLTERQ